MKYKWLNKQNNDKLIVFFNGWGMDEGVVKHLEPGDYDVVMFYDYNNLDTDFSLDKEYSETNVVAWSMGVMIAGLCHCEELALADDAAIHNGTKFVAINGTLKPIDPKYGIHPKIYDLTINGFNEKGRDKFIKNMFDKSCSEIKCSRTLENQRAELIALKNYKANSDFTPNIFTPDRIIISDNDKIIPTKSQCAFWGIEPNFACGHCPFFSFSKWSELL